VRSDKAPARRNRYDVLAILCWVPLCRKQPEITLEEVEKGIGVDNQAIMVQSAYTFWGVTRSDKEVEEAEEVPLEVMESTPSEDTPLET